jgi:hypothetical protein
MGLLVLIPLCGGERTCCAGVVAALAAYLFYAPIGATTPGTSVPSPRRGELGANARSRSIQSENIMSEAPLYFSPMFYIFRL